MIPPGELGRLVSTRAVDIPAWPVKNIHCCRRPATLPMKRWALNDETAKYCRAMHMISQRRNVRELKRRRSRYAPAAIRNSVSGGHRRPSATFYNKRAHAANSCVGRFLSVATACAQASVNLFRILAGGEHSFLHCRQRPTLSLKC